MSDALCSACVDMPKIKEVELRQHRCCFTGHRPQKLHVDEQMICRDLKRAIKEAIRDGYRTFISGMAQGVDIWAAEIVLEEREINPQIRLICALPHPNSEKLWEVEWKTRYKDILERADYIKIVCPKFSIGAYQARNRWMVDHSARVIAIFNGENGGTKKTIEYAQKQGVPVWRYGI